MTETIKSIIDDELSKPDLDLGIISDESASRMAPNAVLRELNSTSNRGLVSLPGEGDLSSSDLKRKVEEENVPAVRKVVRSTLEDLKMPRGL